MNPPGAGGCGSTSPTLPSEYVTGDLAREQRLAYEGHLAGCAACRRAVDAQRRLQGLLGRLPLYRAPADPPADRLRADPPGPRAPADPPNFGEKAPARRLAGAVLAVAAGVLLVVALRTPASPNGAIELARAADRAFVASLAAGVEGGVVPDPLLESENGTSVWLGFVTCSERIAPPTDGLYICALDPDGPLGRLGVRAGDVLLAVGGKPVSSAETLYGLLSRRRSGDEVRVVVRRGDGAPARDRGIEEGAAEGDAGLVEDEARVLEGLARLTERRIGEHHPFDLAWSPALRASLDRPRPAAEDLTEVFIPLPSSQAARFDADEGLLVARHMPREAVERTILAALPYLFDTGGLQPGDLILAVEEHAITDRRSFFFALADVQHGPFRIQVERARARLSLPFDGGTP